MSITHEEYIRRKWGEYPALYKIITGNEVSPCSRRPKEIVATSADYTWAAWESNTEEVLTEFSEHLDLVTGSINFMTNKALLSDLDKLEKAAETLTQRWRDRALGVEKAVLPKIQELQSRISRQLHPKVTNLLQYKYERIEFEVECATRFAEALLHRPDLEERERLAIQQVLSGLRQVGERPFQHACYFCVSKLSDEWWYFAVEIAADGFEVACASGDYREFRLRMMSDGRLATNYYAVFDYLETKAIAEDLALAEWHFGPLTDHIAWAEKAAADLSFEFQMIVDGIEYRSRCTDLEFPELYLEER